MAVLRCVAFVLPLTMVLALPLHPQAGKTDTAQMGLRGLVRTVEVERAGYEERGGWVRQKRVLLSKVDFNKAGYKTEEWSYGGAGSRTTYAYDDAGSLAAREVYSSGRLLSSWERSFGPDGSSTLQLYYESDGSVSSKVLQQFDSAGQKLSEIAYGNKGMVTRRWERRPMGTGSVISYIQQGETARFDSRGRLTEMYRGGGGVFQKWTYNYDAQGRLTEARYTDNEAVSPEIYTFLYDPAGKLLEVSHSRSSGVPVSKRRYTYSGTGRSQTETVDWFGREGTLDHTWIYSYDSAGNVLEKEYRQRLRAFSCRWMYRYDSGGRLTMETFYDSEGRVFTMSETSYDGKGNKVSERSSGRGVDQGFRVIYEYDSAGRLLETVRYDLDGRQESRVSSRYNERGDLLESARYNPDGSLMGSTKQLYVYDKIGNWLERITLATDNVKESYDVPTEVVFRTISYYP